MQRESHQLFDLVHTTLGYWRAQVLLAANDLGVFNLLGEGPATAEEVAERLATPVGYTERLLNAAVATSLLKKEDGRFGNLAMADTFLVAGRPRFMGHWIRLMKAWYEPWGGLADAVRTGKPVEDPMKHLGDDTDYTRDFILGMHDYAMGPGKEIVAHLDLSGRHHLLDLGGGAGSYAILLVEATPGLRATVFDLPAVADIAHEILAESAVGDRIEVASGDYLADDIGSGFDVVLLSNMLHQEDPESGSEILRRAFEAMEPGGTLVIQAMFLNASEDGPIWPALQSLHLLLVYQGGRTYSTGTTIAMAEAVGFVELEVRPMSLLNAESIIVGRKPQ